MVNYDHKQIIFTNFYCLFSLFKFRFMKSSLGVSTYDSAAHHKEPFRQIAFHTEILLSLNMLFINLCVISKRFTVT